MIYVFTIGNLYKYRRIKPSKCRQSTKIKYKSKAEHI